jgi:hypothetical protein
MMKQLIRKFSTQTINLSPTPPPYWGLASIILLSTGLVGYSVKENSNSNTRALSIQIEDIKKELKKSIEKSLEK